MEQKRIWMWSVPRSLSTAFLRCMISRQSCKCYLEPWLESFHLSADRRDFRFPDHPDIEGATFKDRKRTLEAELPDYKEVFVKDHAFRIGPFLDEGSVDEYLPKDFTHTFIIRHPARTVPSLHRFIDKGYSLGWKGIDVLGSSFKEIYQMHKYVTEELGQTSVIIDADDLQSDPEATLKLFCESVRIDFQESMIKWPPLSNEQSNDMQKYIGWFEQALSSSGIKQNTPEAPSSVKNLPEELQPLVTDAIPFYQELYQMRLRKV